MFCQSTGIASQRAEVSLGTTQSVNLLSDGRLIGTLGVGAGAGQTLGRVWPEYSAVLQPWPVITVEPPTQSQFLSYIRSSLSCFRRRRSYEGQHITALVPLAKVVENPKAFVCAWQAEAQPLGHIPGAVNFISPL